MGKLDGIKKLLAAAGKRAGPVMTGAMRAKSPYSAIGRAAVVGNAAINGLGAAGAVRRAYPVIEGKDAPLSVTLGAGAAAAAGSLLPGGALLTGANRLGRVGALYSLADMEYARAHSSPAPSHQAGELSKFQRNWYEGKYTPGALVADLQKGYESGLSPAAPAVPAAPAAPTNHARTMAPVRHRPAPAEAAFMPIPVPAGPAGASAPSSPVATASGQSAAAAAAKRRQQTAARWQGYNR